MKTEALTVKIRITTAPQGVNPAYGLTVGSIHVARPNWSADKEPAYFVDVKHGNNAFPVGIMSHEAEELQVCGHPVGSIASTDEGTHYCSECANDFEPVWYDV